MPSPLVSIIIPAFNRQVLIVETLDSVLAQSYVFWEAIVVDDGSNDQTCAVVASYAEKDKRIKLFQRNREPKGASVCRNIGLESADGKYVVFLDSDDLLSPDCLKTRVAFMSSRPELDFAVFPMAHFLKTGTFEKTEGLKKRDNYLYAYLRHDLPWNITCPIWSMVFVKEHLKGYNESYPRLQDPEFNARALMIENVKFEVLVGSVPDCYCRMHYTKRFNVTILLPGFKLFIEEFSQRIKKRQDYLECNRHLKVTFIEAVRGFYSYYKPQHHIESIRLMNEINRFAYKDGVIGIKTHLLTSLLIFAYKTPLTRVYRGKYVFRTIMKLIKVS